MRRVFLRKPEFTKNSILCALALRGYLTRDIHNSIEYLEAVILERPMLNL